MPLTDVAIRQAKPGTKATKLSDEKGMFLLITPAGGKLWRFKYRFEGKEKLLALGAYPAVSLSEARKRREDARALLGKGKDPSREKQRHKIRRRMEAADTFKAIAAEYCAKRRRDGEKGWAPATATRSEYLLSLLNGSIGSLPIADIEPADILAAIRKIESKGNLESARRTLQLSSMVFRYAVATARLRSDPTRDLRGALTAPTITHYGAITDAEKVGDLLRAIDGYDGSGITKFALQLAPHVFVRPGEIRHAEWSDIDLDQALWVIPAGKTKMRKAHHVPLSRQSVAILREVFEVTGPSGYVFHSIRARTRAMSDNTLNAAQRRLCYPFALALASASMNNRPSGTPTRPLSDRFCWVRYSAQPSARRTGQTRSLSVVASFGLDAWGNASKDGRQPVAERASIGRSPRLGLGIPSTR